MDAQETLAEALAAHIPDAVAGPSDRFRVDGSARGLEATPRWLVAVGYVGVIWLAAYTLAGHPRGSILHAAGVATLLTAVWLLAFEGVKGVSHVQSLAVGRFTSLVVGTGVAVLASSAVGLWLPPLGLSPRSVFLLAGAVLLLASAWHSLVHAMVSVRRVLVVGSGGATVDLIESLATDPEGGKHFELVGVVADRDGDSAVAGVPVLGQMDDLGGVVQVRRPDLVVVAVERNRPQVFRHLLEVAESGFKVVGLPEFYEHAFGRVPVRHLTPAWFMSVLHLYQRPYSRLSKRAFDVVVVAIGLVLTAPLFPLIALLVSRTPGGVIYRQTRLGEGGRPFTIFKFRTMRDRAEELGSATWAAENDPRVTRVGRVLRKTRLDELPQLLNVLRGNMSIVGPRPERPEFLAMLEEEVPYWTRRHLLKPGITGWAQVRSGYAADRFGTEAKLCYDLWYLRHRSLVVDIVICARTLPKLVSGWGAR